MRFQTGYYFRKGMVVQQNIGRTVYGSRGTIVKKTSHFFSESHFGGGGGWACTRYFTVHCVWSAGVIVPISNPHLPLISSPDSRCIIIPTKVWERDYIHFTVN